MADFASRELALACKSWQQAQDIVDRLFDKHLIARAEILPIRKSTENEVQVIMEHIEEDILSLQQAIAELLGHDNFSLQALAK